MIWSLKEQWELYIKMSDWYIVISLILSFFEYAEHIFLKYNLDMLKCLWILFLLHFFMKLLFILFTYKILILSMSFILV
jgi:hypothetical protein